MATRYEINNTHQSIDFECNNEIVRRTLQNAKNLLMCGMGEVPYDRLRGIDRTLLSLPITQLNAVIVREIDRVMEWEPDVEVVDARATMNSDGETIITVTVELDVE